MVNDNGTEVANDSAECAYYDDDGGGEGLPDCLEVAEEGVAAAAVRDGGGGAGESNHGQRGDYSQ